MRWLHIPIVAFMALLVIYSAAKPGAKEAATPTAVPAATSTPHGSPLLSPVKTSPDKPSPTK